MFQKTRAVFLGATNVCGILKHMTIVLYGFLTISPKFP